MDTFEFDTTGTITITNGSKEVTGVGTNWVANYPGILLNIDGLEYPVKKVNSRSSITLVHPFPGVTITNKTYTIVPVHPNPSTVTQTVVSLIGTVNDLIAGGGGGTGGGTGPTGPAGPKGDDGVGVASAIVNAAGHLIVTYTDGRVVDAGLVGGGSGTPTTPAPAFTTQPTVTPTSGNVGTTFTATPGSVSNGTVASRAWKLGSTAIGTGLSVTPSSAGTLTYQETAVGAGGTATSNIRTVTVISVGTQPEPDTGGPEDVIDLTPTGGDVFYAQPNDYTPLNVNVPADATSVTLTRNFTDSELKIRVREELVNYTAASGRYRTNSTTGPFEVTGGGILAAATMSKVGIGNASLRNGNILLGVDQYLSSGALGMSFVDTGKDDTTMTPPKFTYTFKGVTPGGNRPAAILGDLAGPDGIVFNFHVPDWGRSLGCSIGRPGHWETLFSDEFETSVNGANHTIAVTYTDNPNGPGGKLTFFVDGSQIGSEKPTTIKPKFAPGCFVQINASGDNTVNSISDFEVESVEISYDKPFITANYVAVADGSISTEKINKLFVDATGVTTTQPSRKLTYRVGSAAPVDKNIVVGEFAIPATGAAYKVVLENWSSGVGVPHPNEMILTRIAVQDAEFEDAVYGPEQGKWSEFLPQGPVPVIDGIRYSCEAVREGNFVSITFNYSIDRPTEPFGPVETLNTYMVPHKWGVYDKAGTRIATIQQPDKKPLNPSDTVPVFEGPWDGRSVARVSETNRWYPHLTVRSTINWTNGIPPAYSQAHINQNQPTFVPPVPYISHTNGSTNGFDLRIYCGGNGGAGQSNGFSNYKVIPFKWGMETYDSIKTWALTTKDPWKNLYNDFGLTTNAALHLEATPGNSCGRSPIVGPGGTRDDRQIIAEPIAHYMTDVNGVRRHDDLPMKTIAYNYLRSYAADALHPVEGGKMKPLFKNEPRRAITSRNHYYGGGEHNIPEDSGLFMQSGRLDGTTASQNPTTVHVPYGGATAKKPYFGWFEIDQSHAHQFPHIGSGLFKDPTFAMMGTSFSDMCRLYNPQILDSIYAPHEYASRDKAWLFAHATYQWKFASKTSTRLYRRDEIMEWVVADFEAYHDRYYSSTPGFANPPTTLSGSGQQLQNDAVFAGAKLFGPVRWDDSGLGFSAFQCGYWLSALHLAHRYGFLDALRAASVKAGVIVDFLIGLHRKRVTGMINGGMLLNPLDSDYEFRMWTPQMVSTVGGTVSALPQTYGAAATAAGPNPSWDVRKTPSGQIVDRDGQAMDQLLAGPTLLKQMGLSGTDLDQAETTAKSYIQSKVDQENARGPATAGTGWFRWTQTTNCMPRALT